MAKIKENSLEKDIIFVESSIKKATIYKILKGKYLIFATGGHLWEIKKNNKYNLGINLEENFKPEYITINKKENLVKFWRNYFFKKKKEGNKPFIYIATDLDREGEFIGKQIIEILELKDEDYQRLIFYEITPESIEESFKNPLEINKNLIEAQLSRQVLDRMIGFCLSTIIRKIFKEAISAGRVQSLVLRLIVDREEELKKVKKNWIIVAESLKEKRIILKKVNDKLETIIYDDKDIAEKEIKIEKISLELIKKEKEEKIIIPKEPLVTSSLLIQAKFLGFSVSKTTKILQNLYEGKLLKEGKQVGLITYPRTDSTRINNNFANNAYKYIKENWGIEYCNFNPLWKKATVKINVQDAHESIHPTYINYEPENIKESLDKDEYEIYKLIFNNTLASLMSSSKIKKINYYYLDSDSKNIFFFSEKILKFEGFLKADFENYLKIYNIKLESYKNIEKLEVILKVKESEKGKIYRYNEGALIKTLELLGAGRPSTYNMFTNILLKRKYIILSEKGQMIPTELGIKVSNWLESNFSYLFSYSNKGNEENYTAFLEKKLDEISKGIYKKGYEGFISDFWEKFSKKISKFEN